MRKIQIFVEKKLFARIEKCQELVFKPNVSFTFFFKLVSMKLNFYVISKRNLVKMSQFNCIIGLFFFIINVDGSKCEKLQNVLSRKISMV